MQTVGYSDADFAAYRTDRKSVMGGWISIDGMPVSWMVKQQGGVSISTMEAEFTVAFVVVEQMIGNTRIASWSWFELQKTNDFVCG